MPSSNGLSLIFLLIGEAYETINFGMIYMEVQRRLLLIQYCLFYTKPSSKYGLKSIEVMVLMVFNAHYYVFHGRVTLFFANNF